MKPIIGIVPRTLTQNDNYKLQINYSYLEPFNKRGINCIILPLDSPNVEELLPLCQGFLIPGGNDLDPTYYGEINTGLSLDVNESIDKLDKLVIEYAYKNQIPMLGICRGIQSIAAFLGGTLYQDIPHANLAHVIVNHQHFVTTLPNTKLTHLFPKTFMTNTYHHQAVRDLPPGFVTTHVHQQIIEGMIHETLPIIAFQWHPERFQSKESEIIFDYFVDLMKK